MTQEVHASAIMSNLRKAVYRHYEVENINNTLWQIYSEFRVPNFIKIDQVF